MLFEARFFVRGKEGEKVFVGSAQLDDNNTSYAFPLAAKAFRHAPEKARGATRVEFVRLNYRNDNGQKTSRH